MSFVIDLVLIAIAAFIVIRAYRNGLAKSVINLVTDVLAALVAYTLTPLLSGAICNSTVLVKISAGIEATVASVSRSDVGYDVSQFISKIPDTLIQILEKYKVSGDSLKDFVGKISDSGEDAVKEVSDFIAKPTSWIVSNTLSFIAIFIVALIVLRIVSKLITVLFKAPVIKTADRFAGLVFGVVNALFVLWVLSLVISLAVGAFGSFIPKWFGEDVVESSVILKFFSKYNPISFLEELLTEIG